MAALLLFGAPVRAATESVHGAAADYQDLKKHGKPPRLIKLVDPDYPFSMARAGLVGEVTVTFIIDSEGKVQNPYVVESNNPWFERPAIEAVLKWKFEPGEINGRRVNTRARQRIEFNLDPVHRSPTDLWQISKSRDHKKLPPELQWDTPPVPVNTLFPVYPFEQLRAGTFGKAKISYVVGPEGDVRAAKLIEATTPEFGASVLAMIDAWKFSPPKKKNGEAGFASLITDYDFQPTGRGDVPVSEEAREILRDLERKPQAIVPASELDAPLKPLSRRPPVYPSSLLAVNRGGDATVEFFVDENGDVQLPQILSSTMPAFGYAAVQAVATWHFEIPRRKTKPVIVRVQVPLQFKADGKRPSSPAPNLQIP